MPLSEHEQRILEQLEKELRSEDPRLASTMSGRQGTTTARFITAVIAVAAGLGLLIVAVTTALTWIGVIGFVVMFLGVTYALSRPKKSLRFVLSMAREFVTHRRKNGRLHAEGRKPSCSGWKRDGTAGNGENDVAHRHGRSSVRLSLTA